MLGTAEALMATVDESGPRPTRLRAVTLKVYLTSGVKELAVKEVVVTPVESIENAAEPYLMLIW